MRNRSEITHRFGVLQVVLNLLLCMLGIFSMLFFKMDNSFIVLGTLFLLINSLCWVYFSNKTKKDTEAVDEFVNNYMILKNENIQDKR